MAHGVARESTSLCVFRALSGCRRRRVFPHGDARDCGVVSPRESRQGCGITDVRDKPGDAFDSPVVAWITFHYGWRMAFLLTGSVGFFIVPPWLLLHRRIQKAYGMPDPAPAQGRKDESLDCGSSSLGQVLARRKYWLFLLARAFPIPLRSSTCFGCLGTFKLSGIMIWRR